MASIMQNSYDKDWNSYANTIAERKNSPDWAVLREARKSHWDTFFEIRENDHVLDAGCGHGEYTIWALSAGARVWAFDYSDEMANWTSTMIDHEGLKAEAVTQDSVTAIPYPDENFDAVFCLAVLDHLNDGDRSKAMQELYRVLKPGGMLYIDVPNRLALHWRGVFLLMRIFGLYPKGEIHFFTPWEIRSLLKRYGFQPKRSLGLTICPPFSGVYTTDLRRITILPQFLIRPLDYLYLLVEKNLRRVPFLKPLCWHYFIASTKKAKL